MRQFLVKNLHISWHIAAWCWGALLGVASLVIVPVGLFADAAWLVAGLSFTIFVLCKRARWLLAVSVCAGLTIGLWRGAVERQALLSYIPYYGHILLLQGKVNEDAAIGPKGDRRLNLADIRIDNRTFHGQVWASTASGADIKRGDTVFLRGVLQEGFGSTAASMPRARLERIERPYPGDVARRVRDRFADRVRQVISEPQASLGVGYLTGQRSTLPASLDEQLRIAGLTHAVVASGYNLTVLVSFTRRLFSRVSKYLTMLSATTMIGGFVLVTGFSPSMSRAGLIAVLSLVAWYYGRAIHPLVLLPLAAAITVLARPTYIWGDIGWFLSFAAFWGVIMIAPLIREYFWSKETKGGVIQQILTDTFAAQLATIPIILYVFGTFSVYALPANILILPLVPITMLGTFLSGVIGLIIPGLAEIISWPTEEILSYMTWAVRHVAELPGSQEQVTFTLFTLVLSYLMLGLICIYLVRKTKYNFRN